MSDASMHVGKAVFYPILLGMVGLSLYQRRDRSGQAICALKALSQPIGPKGLFHRPSRLTLAALVIPQRMRARAESGQHSSVTTAYLRLVSMFETSANCLRFVSSGTRCFFDIVGSRLHDPLFEPGRDVFDGTAAACSRRGVARYSLQDLLVFVRLSALN